MPKHPIQKSKSRTPIAANPLALPGKTEIAQALAALRAGKLTEAVQFAQRALSVAPKNADTHFTLALILAAAKKMAEAEDRCLVALQFQPTHLNALLWLGQFKLTARQPLPAIEYLERAIKISPRDRNTRHMLARAYGMADRREDALRIFSSLVREEPGNPDILSGYARAAADRGFTDAAIQAFKRAELLKPDDHAIHYGLGLAYLYEGRVDSAVGHFHNAIRLRPDLGPPYTQLAKLDRLSPEETTAIQRELNSIATGNPKRISFLLAQAAIAEKKNTQQCFAALTEAQSLLELGPRRPYEREALADAVRHAVATIGRLPQFHPPASAIRPIFIVGMPRSGSTLTEQVLARHPAVTPAGESDALVLVKREFVRQAKTWPEDLRNLTSSDQTMLRKIYFDRLPEPRDGSMACTDKFLENVFSLPLIETLFPEALIIVCRRHPLDICWSIFSQGFDSNVPFGSSIDNIVHHHIRMNEVLTAWRKAGRNPTLEVWYEEMVERPEETIRGIISFAGLPWTEECLRPAESSRAVLTASAGQVRRPIYRTSMARWKPFAPYLAGAIAQLKPFTEEHEAQLAQRGINYG